MGEGKVCGVDPYWICESGLNCEANVCKKPEVPENMPCGDKVCEATLVCVGRRRKSCMKPPGLGEKCRNNSSNLKFKCAGDLQCFNSKCEKPGIPESRRCEAEGPKCQEGLICVPSLDKTFKLCVKPNKEGEFCAEDPRWQCDIGLQCIDAQCKKHGSH